MPKNQEYWFFIFHSPLWKPEKSAPFSHKKHDILRIFLRYKVNHLSWVIVYISLIAKELEREFARAFLAFGLFLQVEKSRLSPFSFGLCGRIYFVFR